MLRLDRLEDLQTLHANRVQESSTLEYKASGAIDNTEGKKLEMSKDISAMANAEGGQIIYGMTEADHVPTGLDAGVNPSPFNGLWFEQVIQQNIRPSIEGLKILQLALGGGNVCTVITVPRSKTVHQSKDGRYYRRRNFRNDVMLDYEIREALNRSQRPDLFLDLRFEKGSTRQMLHFSQQNEISNAIPLFVAIGNRADEPALYTLIEIMIDAEIRIGSENGFGRAGLVRDDDDREMSVFTYNIVTPHAIPVFRGPLFAVGKPFEVLLHSSWLQRRETFPLWYRLSGPGFSTLIKGQLVLDKRILTIEVPK